MLQPRKSVEDYGGLQPYLDDVVIRSRHNGYGYDDLVRNYDHGPAFIRDLFRIGGKSKDRTTATRWINMYKKELENE